VSATHEVTVCFADLVGFTRFGERRPAEDLGRVAERLGALVSDLAEPPVRLVKTLGDAAMLVSPGWEDGLYQQMRDTLTSDRGRGRKLYAQRKITIEPVFGQIKYNRRIDRFMRRGRAAAQSEWRLVTATHNLLKLHSHWIANTA